EFAQQATTGQFVEVPVDRHVADTGELHQLGRRCRSVLDDVVGDPLLPRTARSCTTGRCLTTHDHQYRVTGGKRKDTPRCVPTGERFVGCLGSILGCRARSVWLVCSPQRCDSDGNPSSHVVTYIVLDVNLTSLM